MPRRLTLASLWALLGLALVALAALGLLVLARRVPLAPTGTPARASFAPALVQRGALLAAVGDCIGCHALGRQRSSGGALPLPLAIAVYDDEPHSLLRIVREGVAPPIGSAGRLMPAFGTALSGEQLGALAAYLRHAAAGQQPWPQLDAAVKETR